MVKKTLVLITDAWSPLVNGVVTTYKNMLSHLPKDYTCIVISPDKFKRVCVPFYNEIEVALCTRKMMSKEIMDIMSKYPECKFHIATEGVLGVQAKRALDKLNIKYTTAYHTKFPEFIREIVGMPTFFTRWYFDWFHKKSKYVFMSSESVSKRYPKWKCVVLNKGYSDYYRPPLIKKQNEIPVLLYVGRVSKEKNIEDFCKINVLSKKIVVGDGPILCKLSEKYPNVYFIGYKFKSELAEYYKLADVFVFPSKSDTYGIVVLEAMACGTPVAAYPVDGAIDQIKNGVNGYMHEDLNYAVVKCLDINREQTRQSVEGISWENSTKKFIEYLEK